MESIAVYENLTLIIDYESIVASKISSESMLLKQPFLTDKGFAAIRIGLNRWKSTQGINVC